MTTLLFDIETDGLLDELTTIHCAVFKNVETNEVHRVVGLADILEDLRGLPKDVLLVAHNALGFDLPAIQKFLPEFNPKILDTLVCSRVIWSDLKERDFRMADKKGPEYLNGLRGSHSLKAWGQRLGILKGDFGETTDWKQFTPEMLEYCTQDVEVLHALFNLIQSKGYAPGCLQLEHDFKRAMVQMERRGFTFNKTLGVELYAKLSAKRQALREELLKMHPGWYTDLKTPAYWVDENGNQYPTKGAGQKAKARGLTPGPPKQKHTEFNPGSRDHIARVFREKYSWEPKAFTNEGKPQVDEKILKGLVYPEAKILSEFLELEKHIGQLAEGNQAWLKQVQDDGRIHGEINTNGAVTGRCTHSKPNMAQVPAERDYRCLFQASPGMTLVGCDASGLELRCLAHYMAEYDNGAYAQELLHGDIHTANQKAAGLPTRDNAKTFIYGFLYGAGDAKIGSIIGGSARRGKELRESFLSKLPALKKLTDRVKRQAKTGTLVGLDGRTLPVRSEHSALNTLLQSAGAVIVKKATVLFLEEAQRCSFGPADFGIVAHIHDEIQIESRPGIASEIGRIAAASMARAGDLLGLRCPIAGEYKIGPSWAETH